MKMFGGLQFRAGLAVHHPSTPKASQPTDESGNPLDATSESALYPMARKLKSILIAGPAGRLEALLEEPVSTERIQRTVVLCHPHPQYGGTMHNKVVYRMAKAARADGALVLRFNFRGVGASTGIYDGGRGEQDDLRAAMHFLRDRHLGVPLIAGGFSFGARVSLAVCCSDPLVDRVVAVGTPVVRGDFGYLANCSCPKHFIHSTNDEYGPRESLGQVVKSAAEPKSITWIEAADHFFTDALDEMESAVRRALQ